MIYAVNVKGMSRVIQVVSNYMKERRYGKIINIDFSGAIIIFVLL